MTLYRNNQEATTRILDFYSEHLPEEDRALIIMLSATRGYLEEGFVRDLPIVLGRYGGSTDISYPYEEERERSIERLINHGILNYDPLAHSYIIPQLIRTYYEKILEEEPNLSNQVHLSLCRYYLSRDAVVRDIRNIKRIGVKSLDDLRQIKEAVHHACKCGEYSFAWRIYTEKINARRDRLLTDRLGAYDTALSIMREFFLDGDLEKEPCLVSDEEVASILANTGFYLMSLGHLEDALSVMIRQNDLARKMKFRIMQSIGYQNLSRLYIYLGELEKATVSARRGIRAAEVTRADCRTTIKHKINSMCILAWSLHLRGYLNASGDLFQKARMLNSEIGNGDFLTKFIGYFNISCLLMQGNLQEARLLAEANLEEAEFDEKNAQISRCHRLLGDLDAADGKVESAMQHYDLALKVAKNIYRKEILIEALLSLGRLRIKRPTDLLDGYRTLKEALEHATYGGYRLYEVDIRYNLAYALLEIGNIQDSKDEAKYAWQVSRHMGYYWGKKEAKKVFSVLKTSNHNLNKVNKAL